MNAQGNILFRAHLLVHYGARDILRRILSFVFSWFTLACADTENEISTELFPRGSLRGMQPFAQNVQAKEWMYSAIKRFTQLVLQFLRRHVMHEHNRPSCTRYFLVNHPTTKMIQHLYVICTFEVSLSNVLSNKISWIAFYLQNLCAILQLDF